MNELNRYMNDPDIIGEPMTLREIHAIRLMLSDEIKSMPEEERTDYFNKRTEAFVERCGFKIQHRESSKSFKIVNDL